MEADLFPFLSTVRPIAELVALTQRIRHCRQRLTLKAADWKSRVLSPGCPSPSRWKGAGLLLRRRLIYSDWPGYKIKKPEGSWRSLPAPNMIKP